MTLEQALQQLNDLNAVYNLGNMARATYLKKHKAISNKYKKLNRPMTYSERIRSEGIKITRQYAGWYTYIGKNFTVEFNEDSCETTWWEVNLYGDNMDKRVHEYFYDFNHFYTKAEVVSALYELDKRLTDEA
jgi:hypothetical protein